jgi:hypothetical protein
VVTGEVEERLHKALASHPLERIERGYRRAYPGNAGTSILRIRPVDETRDGLRVIGIAEIVAEHGGPGLPNLHATGVQRLNALAVYGAFRVHEGRIRQEAHVSLYENETAVHFVTQTILNAFGAQLPIGRSILLAATAANALEQQRAHHAMPTRWDPPLEAAALERSVRILRERGFVAAHDDTTVWAEFPLSGACPSRSIDPEADTALLQVNTAVPHPIAGAGYLATILLPIREATPNGAELCRRLNALELEHVEFVPRLGAWGLHGSKELPGYSCFLPYRAPLADVQTTLMFWCARRAAWLRERWWVARTGLDLERKSAA